MVTIGDSEGTNLINIQYSVMFGVIFSLSFCLKTSAGFHVEPSIAKANLLVFGLSLLYFLSNWVTANFVKELITFNVFYVVTWTLGIWYLGAAVIMMNSDGELKYVLLSLYIVAIGIYDFIAYRKTCLRNTEPRYLSWAFLAGLTLIIGIYFMFQSTMMHLKIVQLNIDLQFMAVVVLSLLLFIRGLIRNVLVLRRSENE